MSDWHLAQINIGKMVAPEGDSRMQPFFDALDRINGLADMAPGFVWRLVDETGADATELRPTVDPLLLINMSVWQDAESLFDFVYRSAHTPVMAKRRDYFDRFDGTYQALWWIPAGTIPTISDGLARIWHLEHFGPTPHSFHFKSKFDKPGTGTIAEDMKPDPWCVGNC